MAFIRDNSTTIEEFADYIENQIEVFTRMDPQQIFLLRELLCSTEIRGAIFRVWDTPLIRNELDATTPLAASEARASRI